MAATTVPRSHSRGSSIPDFDFNPSFSFPAQPAGHPKSTGLRFPLQIPGSESGVFPPRRGSVPVISTIAEASVSARPKSSQADALNQLSANSKQMEDRVSGPPSPDYTISSSSRVRPAGRTIGDGMVPTILSATVRSHNREASELLQVPMLEPRLEESTIGPPLIQKRAPPPPGVNLRKGHAHRRSGAISSSDVWSLMNQTAPPLPAPPATITITDHANTESSWLSSGASANLLNRSAPASPSINAEQPPKTPNSFVSDIPSERSARVCFTDSVQIIPRPISIATGSSASTARRHSVTGSVSSFAALNSAPPPLNIDTTATRAPSPNRRPHNRTRSNSQTLAQPTAALRALSDRTQGDRPSTAGAILASPQVTQAPELNIPEDPSLKRPASNSPFVNENASSSKPPSKKAHKKAQSDFSPLMMSSEFGAEERSPGDGNGKKKKKGKKQIRGWAGNILGKKGKRKSKKSKRAPTPPVSRSAEDLTPRENEWVATSWNESYVIMPIDATPLPAISRVAMSGCPSSPVIDLDAALGPFNTPVESHTGFAAARRRMHSAASRGSGSFFHRRSESLPEMELFALEEDEDRTMEDVFEEEEDDNDCSTSEEESSESEDDEEDEGQIGGDGGLGIGIRTEEGWPNKGGVHVSHIIDANHKRLSNGTITAVTVSSNNVIPDNSTVQRTSSRRKAAPADIITPQSSLEDMSTPAATFKPSFIGPALDSPSTFVTAASSPNTPVQHEFSCRDSSCSFDPYRDYLGEPGPEMRMSVDDIPSLTSSSSTMTMNAAYLGMPSTPSANEMLPLPTTTVASKDKKEKSKRWSRIWGFWKSK